MNVTIEQLFEAGAHFGHQTRRWNPKMAPFIYGTRGGVHILDLTKTVDYLAEACKFAEKVTAGGGLILFVGTKRQAAPIIRSEAEEIGMPYMAERWLGGTLTNFRTIKLQVSRLNKLRAQLADENLKISKKDRSQIEAEVAKLEQVFRGIEQMEELPQAVFVVDLPREEIAVREARKLGIPVVAITDSNADPKMVDQMIPANDDAIKAIKLITHAICEAAATGKQAYQAKTKETPAEEVAAPTTKPVEKAVPKPAAKKEAKSAKA